LNLGVVKQWQIPIPPLAEQAEIVYRVEKLLGLFDKIDSRYTVVQKQVDRLPQSVLSKAFHGELVPTEAEVADREGRSFESAEALLQQNHNLKQREPEPREAEQRRPRIRGK
jgi:type I restriction enzyme S subunit